MIRVFADTYFYIALLNTRDTNYQIAVHWRRTNPRVKIVTTSWVFIELADSMRLPHERKIAGQFIQRLRGESSTDIVRASEDLLRRGFDLYRSRPDKEWSLTDCLSFVVMSDQRLTDALTGDHHFEQAGFRALLAE